MTIGRAEGVAGPCDEAHGFDGRIVFGDGIEPRVAHDEGAVRPDHVLTERLLDRVLAIGDVRTLDADATLPEGPTCIDHGDERVWGVEHLRGEPGESVEWLFGTGVQQPGRGDGRQAFGIEERS